MIAGSSVRILTSSSPRAHDSANILAERFGVPVTPYDVWWSENDHPENFDGALAIVDQHADEADVLVVVTHYEYVRDFPHFFGQQRLGVNTIPRKLIEKGQAWLVDIEKKSAMIVG